MIWSWFSRRRRLVPTVFVSVLLSGIIAASNLAWSSAEPGPEKPPPRSILLFGNQSARDWLQEEWGVAVESSAREWLFEPAASTPDAVRPQFNDAIAALEAEFVEHGSYPSEFTSEPGWSYETDGSDFELGYDAGGLRLAYSSQEGYQVDEESESVAKAWPLFRKMVGYGPWKRTVYEGPEFAQSSLPVPSQADLRVKLLPRALPKWARELELSHEHYELEVDLRSKRLRLKAFRQPEALTIPEKLGPLPERSFCVVGQPEFLARFGMKGDKVRRGLAFSRALSLQSLPQLAHFMDAAEPLETRAKLAAAEHAGAPWAHGRVRLESRNGMLFDCQWRAGKEVHYDWLEAHWQPYVPTAAENLASKSCDYDEGFPKRRTVASYR